MSDSGLDIKIPPVTIPPIQPADSEQERELKVPPVTIPPVQPADSEQGEDYQIPLIELKEVDGAEDEQERELKHTPVTIPPIQPADSEQERELKVPPVVIPPIQPVDSEQERELKVPPVVIPPVQPADSEQERELKHTPVTIPPVQPADSEPTQRKQFFFAEGAWIPDVDPLIVGEKNFADIQNLYQRGNILEGVPGYTKINTTALTSYLKVRSGIQLRSPFTTKSRILAQVYNTGLTESKLIQNTAVVPAQEDFVGGAEATALHTDAAGAGLGRFSRWPQDHIAYCNGVESKLYAGDEIRCSAFLTSSAAVTGAIITNPKDYSDAMQNSLQTADQVAIIGGGNDSLTKVLLDFETKDGANIADLSAGGTNDGVLIGAADWSTDWAKFGTKSGKISAAGDAFSIADSADLDFGTADGTIDFRITYLAPVTAAGTYTYASGTGRITCSAGTDFTAFSVGDPIVCFLPSSRRVGHVISKDGANQWIEVAGDSVDADSYSAVYAGSALCGRYEDANNYWYVAQVFAETMFVKASAGAPSFAHVSSFYIPPEGAHVAIVQVYGTSLKVYLNGYGYSLGNVNLQDLAAAPLTFGRCRWGAAVYAECYQATAVYFDEIRLSKGVARWTANFSPPMAPYISDSSIKYLTFLAGFTRPVQAVKLYLSQVNQIDSSITGKESTNVGWSGLVVTDGTKPASVSLAQTGSLSFPTTVGSAIVRYIEGRVLYWYQFTLSEGEAVIYQVTGDCPFQSIRDCWDGVELILSACLRYVVGTTSYKDYTLDIADDSQVSVAVFNALTTATEWILLGSPVPLMGFNVRMSNDAAKVNTAAAVMSVYYCDGGAMAAWPIVNGLSDGTVSAAGKSMSGNGVVSFFPVASGQEFKVAINDADPKYYYKITFGATLSATVESYYITGIAVPTQIQSYKFPFMYRNRPMLCNAVGLGELNRVDFGMVDTIAGFNGQDSSFGVDSAPLYFGGAEALTGAIEIYNKVGSTLYHIGIFCKDRETYILTGYDQESFQILKVSGSIGCPAPLTMDTIEIGYGDKPDDLRCIALWLSYSGLVIYDTAAIVPIPGLTCYFDPDNPLCINFAAITNARGWVDPVNITYNLQIPIGDSTTNNLWLVLDLKTMRFSKKVPSCTSPHIQATIPVSDVAGRPYTYGCRDNGYMMRLENGVEWDGSDSERFVLSADMLPTGSIWDKTRLTRGKLILLNQASATESVAVTHYADGASSGTALSGMTLVQTGANRHARVTAALNLIAWSHQFKFAITTDDTVKGVKLLGWGMEFQVEREDL